MLLDDIHCPGDTILYNCAINSNMENLNLKWSVQIPNQKPIMIAYNDTTLKGVVDMPDMNIRATLVEVREGLIQSVLTLVVMSSSMNMTRVDCYIPNLSFDTVTVLINISGERLCHLVACEWVIVVMWQFKQFEPHLKGAGRCF